MLAPAPAERNESHQYCSVPIDARIWHRSTRVMSTMALEYLPVVAAGEIEEKSFSCFEVNGVSIVICRFRDEYFAIENQCSHARSRFDSGRLRGYRIMCPLHAATFDIRDGSATSRPARLPIGSYPCRVLDGMVEVELEKPR